LEKKIIAALELADHEVRLVVGQFFNGRLNVLKVERVAHNGISNYTIIDPYSVKKAIQKAFENASRNIGSTLSSTLVVVPGVNMTRVNSVQTASINGTITQQDLVKLYDAFYKTDGPREKVLVNVLMNRFHVNGLPTRKIPLNERCNELSVEADCYFCDKGVVFDYLKVVENAGIRVIDIIMSDIGVAKEASLLEQSISESIIATVFERDTITLTLYQKGQIMTNIMIDAKIESIFNKIKSTYNFDDSIAERLLYYNVDINDVSPSLNPIFAWSTKSGNHALNKKDLLDLVGDDLIQILDEIHDVAKPIFMMGDARYVVTGESSVIMGIVEILKTISQTEVSLYRPSTFGAKDPTFTAVLGAFYFYKDTSVFKNNIVSSLDEAEFYRNTIYQESKPNSDTSTNSFTKRFKELFID
jgi:cell division protein FtsA